MSRFNSWVAGARVKFLAQGNTAAAGNRTRAPNLEPHDYQAGALPTELLLPPIYRQGYLKITSGREAIFPIS